MPVDLTKVTPSTTRKSRSMLSQIRPAKEMTREDFKFKALLLGDSGGGKSTSALTLPGRKLVIDLDGRQESLVGFPDTELLQIVETDPESPTAWNDLEALKNELWSLARSGDFLYEGIIIDGFTRLGRYAMNMALQLTDANGRKMSRGPGGGPAQPHYLPQMNALTKFTMQMLPLPCHIIFTGHIDIYEDKTLNTINFYPKITGKIRTEVSSWFNETYLCYRDKKGYHWTTAPQGRYTFLKSAANQLGKFWDQTLTIDFDHPPTGFAEILELRFGKEN
jgi:hypothetical protein